MSISDIREISDQYRHKWISSAGLVDVCAKLSLYTGNSLMFKLNLGISNVVNGSILGQAGVQVRAIQWVLVLLNRRVIKSAIEQLISIRSPP